MTLSLSLVREWPEKMEKRGWLSNPHPWRPYRT